MTSTKFAAPTEHYNLTNILLTRFAYCLLPMLILKTHHFLKLHSLPPAHLNFFAAFQFKKQSPVEIRFDLVDHPEVHDMFAISAEEKFLIKSFLQRIQ